MTIEIRRDDELVETRTRDAAGRVLTRRYPGAGLETYAYESSGELRAYTSDSEPDDNPDLLLAWERAGDGRLLARDWRYPHVADRDVFTWICP